MAKRRPAGDGMVRRRDDGRWEGRIVIGHRENGEPLFRHVYAKTQKALLDKLHQNIECYRDVELTEDSRMTLGQWLDRWLTEYKAGTVRPGTLEGYRRYIEYYIKPQLGDKQISLLSQQDIQRMYRRLKTEGRIHEHPEMGHQLSDSMVRHIHSTLHAALKDAVQAHVIPRNPTKYGEGLSDRMVRMCHATCRSALEKAVQDGLIRVNPAIGCKLQPKKARGMQVLTREELQRFLIQAKFEGYYEAFLLDLATGLRRGELMALQWDDLNFKTGVLNVNKQVYDVRGQLQISTPKTKNSVRKIVLPPAVVAVLQEYKKTVDSRWMFPSPVKEDCPITPGVVRRRLQFILEHAGCKHVRFHDLRHPYVKPTTKKFITFFEVFRAAS